MRLRAFGFLSVAMALALLSRPRTFVNSNHVFLGQYTKSARDTSSLLIDAISPVALQHDVLARIAALEALEEAAIARIAALEEAVNLLLIRLLEAFTGTDAASVVRR
ncbi:hypothetical protein N7528_006616 [Penicillium herquei]|nr:hypothetical protein N7528_006616 [Penicillium herquei]